MLSCAGARDGLRKTCTPDTRANKNSGGRNSGIVQFLVGFGSPPWWANTGAVLAHAGTMLAYPYWYLVINSGGRLRWWAHAGAMLS